MSLGVIWVPFMLGTWVEQRVTEETVAEAMDGGTCLKVSFGDNNTSKDSRNLDILLEDKKWCRC
jgi:hypothetical protein